MQYQDKKLYDVPVICIVATVFHDGDLDIHFDGRSISRDYITEPSSSDIHPIGWFDQCGHKHPEYTQKLQPPKGKSTHVCRSVD